MNSATKLNKTKRKRSLSTEQTEVIFIEMWEEKIDELRGKRRNSHIYKEMAAELAKNSIAISPEEVKAKITNLTVKFRKCKSCIGPSGGSPSTWPHYDRVNRIIGSQPGHNLTGLVEDSIIDIQDSQSGAKNKKLIEMFERFGNSFEQAMDEAKECTEELLALEREKIQIFKNISDSTEKLTSGILDFLKNCDKKDNV